METRIELKRLNDYLWEIPQSGAMRTSGRIYASAELMQQIRQDQSLAQVANVACLPGIVGFSMAMPDMHWGYGFAIGGVAAFDRDEGIISPGGVGYDINCGVRLMRTALVREEVEPHLSDLVGAIFSTVPSGVGSSGRLKLKPKELERVVTGGARWALQQGHGEAADLEHIEEGGCMRGADPGQIGSKAYERGRDQLGTLGSGNHFIEIGCVDEVYDEEAAQTFGLFLGGVTITIHTGSRGFGHQVAEDSLRRFAKAAPQYGIELPDRQLCCAPIRSKDGQAYLAAMAGAVNFAFANRQVIGEWVHRAFQQVLRTPPHKLGLRVVYEVAHNIAKMERHSVEGRLREVCVHRKGATRAFPAGHEDVPADYRQVGQPVLIPGDMGRYSFVLAGAPGAMEQTFGSTCHGAGRRLSRKQAMKQVDVGRVIDDMTRRGIVLMAKGRRTIAEEVPEAYKDVSLVVDTVVRAGLSRKVARLRPLGVVKG